MADPLSPYRSKRSFKQTPEPRGAERAGSADAGAPRFVIHEHHATRLHWDLRLEHEGVLVSWAIPNGLPEAPKDNRAAPRTEDHPLEYLEFHGEIPAGSYGAGAITIWDSGTYDVLKWSEDKVEVHLHGERVDARYALFAIGKRDEDSGDWMIHRMDAPDDRTAEPMPESLAPMLARAGELPGTPGNDDTAWAFEIKWDGIRALCRSAPGRVSFTSRNGHDLTATYPELRRIDRGLSHHRAILDGEIVAFDADGRPDFGLLQRRMNLGSESAVRRVAPEVPVTFVIFDLLWFDGHPLVDLSWDERRERLAELELDGPAWRTPAARIGDGTALLAAATEQRLEGVVAKRRESRYEPGRRSGAWIKVKLLARQEFVIGGWLAGEGRRASSIGALLVGVREAGELRYAGRVGTGFSDAMLSQLGRRLEQLERPANPFAGRRGPRGARFLDPVLVCEVAFTEWTRDGLLRHPSFQGLRDDKSAREVVRESGGGLSAGATGRRDGPSEGEVEGRKLRLSNLDKVLYPRTGTTKGDVIDYYARIAPVLLGHLRGRALTRVRFPDGVEAKSFFEKAAPSHTPDWVQTTRVRSRRSAEGAIDYIVAADLPTLIWLANLAALELHPSLALAAAGKRPTVMVFDLDPGEPATIVECCAVALLLRGLLEGLGLACVAKTSGSKGLQVYVPLNHPDATFDATKGFSREIAQTFAARMPELVVSTQAKAKRAGRVLIDWSQNDEHKTTVAVYSLRAREAPTVSTPVAWKEVETCRDAGDPELLRFRAAEVLERVAREGDLFADVLSVVQELPPVG